MNSDKGSLPAADDLEMLFEEGASELANTYAAALLNAAEEAGQAEGVLADLEELVHDIWHEQKEFAALLSYGLTNPERRDRVLNDVFKDRVQPVLMTFLHVLARRERLVLLPLIARPARELWDRRNKRVPVTVRSAVPLDDGLREALRAKLSAMLAGGTPILSEEVDPELIGGLVVQIGDGLYDASVRSGIDQVHEAMIRRGANDLRRRRDLVVELTPPPVPTIRPPRDSTQAHFPGRSRTKGEP